MATVVRGSSDSLYRTVRARLVARGYRIDQTDARRHRLVVRAPDQDTKVEVRIAPQGDSATITVAPIGSGDLVSVMTAVLTVTHDAVMEGPGEPEPAALPSGELPVARWRPELFVSSQGALWMARGGLYTADSLRGTWRRVRAIEADSVDGDELRMGVSMALVDGQTALLGLPDRFGPEGPKEGPHVFRTTDGGTTWSPIPSPDLAEVDAMEAIGPSVWVFATRWEDDTTRRATFLRSDDGGATWERPTLPAQLNNISHVYRVSASNAYVATWRSNHGPVFWRTSDSGTTWTPIATPHDQGLLEIPTSGVRVEQIAAVGEWLVVREYGVVFASRTDSLGWRRLAGVKYVAADRERNRLFVLTDSLHAEVLDPNLAVVWRSEDRIPVADATNVEKILAHGGIGYVSLSNGSVYEARDGTLQLVRPQGPR